MRNRHTRHYLALLPTRHGILHVNEHGVTAPSTSAATTPLPSTEIDEEAVYFDADERVVGTGHGDGVVGGRRCRDGTPGHRTGSPPKWR